MKKATRKVIQRAVGDINSNLGKSKKDLKLRLDGLLRIRLVDKIGGGPSKQKGASHSMARETANYVARA